MSQCDSKMAEPSEREKGGGKEAEAEEPDNVSSSSSGIALFFFFFLFLFLENMEGKNDRLHFGGALVCPGVVCGWTGERSTADNTLSPSFFLFYFSFWPVPAA